MILLCWLMGWAHAITPDDLQARLAEVAPLRAHRIRKDAPPISAAEVRKVAGGSIVTGLNGSKAYGAAIVDVPIGRFWAALNDETRHPGYTKVTYSELLTGRVCQSGRTVLQYLPVPWLADRWWIGQIRTNTGLEGASGGAVRELSFSSSVDPTRVTSDAGKKMIAKAEPIGFSKGGWLLVALDERHTYLEYYLWTDPGGSIPSSMASMFATKGVKGNIEAIRKFAKEKTPSCAIR